MPAGHVGTNRFNEMRTIEVTLPLVAIVKWMSHSSIQKKTTELLTKLRKVLKTQTQIKKVKKTVETSDKSEGQAVL